MFDDAELSPHEKLERRRKTLRIDSYKSGGCIGPDVRDETRSGKRGAAQRLVAIRREAFKSLAAGTPGDNPEAPAAAANPSSAHVCLAPA